MDVEKGVFGASVAFDLILVPAKKNQLQDKDNKFMENLLEFDREN